MKKQAAGIWIGRGCLLLVLLVILAAIPLQAFAEDGPESTERFQITGFFDGQFRLSSNRGNIFHLENFAPGDRWEGQIEVENDTSDPVSICVKSIVSNIEDTTLFDALQLSIRSGEKFLYSGPYHPDSDPVTPFLEISPNKTMIYDVVVELPASIGNYVQGKEMNATWTFASNYYGNGETKPTTPNETKPENNQGGSSNNKPQTGDNLASENTANIFVLFVFLFAGMAAIIVALRIRSMKKEQAHHRKEGK